MTESKPEVKFDAWIRRGFEVYRDNIVVLAPASLIICIISFVTIGILTGPMMAGLVWIILSLMDRKEPKPQIGDVFKGFDFLLNSFLFFLVWGIAGLVICWVGSLTCLGGPLIAPALFALSTFLMFGVFLIVDRKMDFWPASTASMDMVKKNFLPFAGLMLLASLMGYAGILACGIGVIVTMPLTFCVLAAAYRDIFGTEQPN